MTDISEIRQNLFTKSDLDWFDSICGILKKENNPTVSLMINIIGEAEPNPNNQIRGSKFLIPFDERFVFACVNPDIDITENDANLQYLSVGGNNFKLNIGDIKVRFGHLLVQSNIYDGGTQMFFHPVPDIYEFSAISFDLREEKEDIGNIDDLIVHSVSFHFRKNLIKLRDGYSMTS